MTTTMASTLLLPLTAHRPHRGSYHLDCVRGLASQGQYASSMRRSAGLPERGAFSSAKAISFIEAARLLPRNFR